MRNFIFSFIVWLSILPAQAATISDISFADQVEVATQTLKLNGLGIRHRAFFKVYAVGLYLPKTTNNDKEVIAMQGAKRLHAVMFRDVEGDLLGRLLMQGIRDNSTQPEALQHATTILQLGQSFAERKKILAGESFTIDFSAEQEVQIYVNKTPLGKPLKSPAFNALLLKIWLGDKPVDNKLKASLLGIS